MNGFCAFFKKEWLEGMRTYKLWIMLVVFCIFGIMSPLFAKITPELLKSLATEGMQITISTPTALDSYMQFFKNVSQMGVIIVLLIFSGSLPSELSKGTLIPVLTKGLSRNAVIAAKFSYITLVWTLSYGCSFLITYVYTILMFPTMPMENLIFSVMCLWLFGCFLISVSIFASVLVKGNYGGLLLTAVCFACLLIVNMVPSVRAFNPATLMSDTSAMLDNTYVISDIYPAIIISGVLCVVCQGLAMLVFRKKQV